MRFMLSPRLADADTSYPGSESGVYLTVGFRSISFPIFFVIIRIFDYNALLVLHHNDKEIFVTPAMRGGGGDEEEL